MDKIHEGGAAAKHITEDTLACAARYLELVIEHHDSLEARIRQQTQPGMPALSAEVSILRRQLHVQVAIIESATAIVDDLALCNSSAGPYEDEILLAGYQQQLLDEIRGLADRSVPA